MTVLDQRKTIANIKKKGFKEQSGGKHATYNYETLDGKRTPITTHVSRSPKHKNISGSLLSHMADQCSLSREEFIRFAICEMEQLEYEMLMKGRGQI